MSEVPGSAGAKLDNGFPKKRMAILFVAIWSISSGSALLSTEYQKNKCLTDPIWQDPANGYRCERLVNGSSTFVGMAFIMFFLSLIVVGVVSLFIMYRRQKALKRHLNTIQ